MTILITETEKQKRKKTKSPTPFNNNSTQKHPLNNTNNDKAIYHKIKLLELHSLLISSSKRQKNKYQIDAVQIHSPYVFIIVRRSIFVFSLLSIDHWNPLSTTESNSPPEPILHLKSHPEPITNHHIYTNRQFKTILVTCCPQKIILWNIDLIANRELTKGTVLGQDLGEVLALHVQEEHQALAVALSDCVLILDLNEMKMRVQIQITAPSAVTDVRFLSYDMEQYVLGTSSRSNSSTERKELCIVESDGTITIWNWNHAECLWRSSIETGFGFVDHSLTVDSLNDRRIALACLDGVVKVYEYTTQALGTALSNASQNSKRPFFRLLHTLPEMFKVYLKYFDMDVLSKRGSGAQKQNKEFRVVSAEPIWKQQNDFLKEVFSSNPIDQDYLEELKVQLNSITALKYLSCCDLSILMVGTVRAIFFFDMQSYDVLYIIDQGEERAALSYDFSTSRHGSRELIHIYSVYEQAINILDIDFRRVLKLSENRTSSQVTGTLNISEEPHLSDEAPIVVGNRSRKKNIPFPITSQHSDNESDEEDDPDSTTSSQDLSIFASGKLPAKLSSTFSKSNMRKNSKLPKDKPVTFHTKIRSSGYGKDKPFGMGPSSRQTKTSKSSAKRLSATSKKPYPVTSNPPTRDTKLKKTVHNAPVFALRLSHDGSRLATCSSDHSARIFRFPLSKSEASCFMSHTNVVSDVQWSFSKKHIITSSTDCRAIMWSVQRAEPILTFSQVKNNSVSQDRLKLKSETPVFKHAVKNAQFFYLDKFVTLCTSNQFFLYKYHIAPLEKDQILQKGFKRNKYKLILNFKSEAQTFTCASCVNSFMSPLIFLGGSNKSLQVYDVTKEKIVKCVDNAHGRPISRIMLNEHPASNQSSVSNPHNMFATQAPDESMRLWDLRSQRCVRQFNAHKNSVQSIGGSFSPCMRFFATGSEDRCAYVYDLGSGSVIEKLQGHSDVVSDVAFHPQRPMLITSSFDHCVKIFSV